MDFPAGYWHLQEDGRIRCELCPRGCQLKDGQRGFCFVRHRVGDEMRLSAYNMASGFAVDPIEKKPLNHFFPGSKILSFGMIGCNLGCKFCQNWNISKTKDEHRLQPVQSAKWIADLARAEGARSIAMTYNDPVPYIEFGTAVKEAAKAEGLETVLVTAGYVSKKARPEYFENVDAANIDLKSFSAEFYKRLCQAELKEVLDTLVYVREKTELWLELTNLIIPTENDSPSQIREMCRWVKENLGADTPLHLSAFHPDYKLVDLPATPLSTLRMAWEIAKEEGLHYVYTGNVHDVRGDATLCPSCQTSVIERDWYRILGNHLQGGRCPNCGTEIAGRFAH